jgi:hypothetical protein
VRVTVCSSPAQPSLEVAQVVARQPLGELRGAQRRAHLHSGRSRWCTQNRVALLRVHPVIVKKASSKTESGCLPANCGERFMRVARGPKFTYSTWLRPHSADDDESAMRPRHLSLAANAVVPKPADGDRTDGEARRLHRPLAPG